MSGQIKKIEDFDLHKKALIPAVEALLFVSDSPLPGSKIKEIVGVFTEREIRIIVEYLNQEYEKAHRSFRIREIAEGYQMFTLPEYATYIEKLYTSRHKSHLSQKALETLAIIAYKQPITRHEIEDIRGVNVDGVIRTLLSRHLITIAGRAQAPGSPFLYKTTKTFLEYFGLKSLKDLPELKEFDEILEADEEIHQKFGDRILKEISPEILGLMKNGENKSENNDTTENEK